MLALRLSGLGLFAGYKGPAATCLDAECHVQLSSWSDERSHGRECTSAQLSQHHSLRSCLITCVCMFTRVHVHRDDEASSQQPASEQPAVPPELGSGSMGSMDDVAGDSEPGLVMPVTGVDTDWREFRCEHGRVLCWGLTNNNQVGPYQQLFTNWTGLDAACKVCDMGFGSSVQRVPRQATLGWSLVFSTH